MKRLWQWVLVAGCLMANASFAQNPLPAPPPGNDDTITRGTKLDASDAKPDSGKEQPIFAYVLAMGGTALVLFIICSPSRKS